MKAFSLSFGVIIICSMTATFTNGDTTIKRPAFWDGGNIWKIRFAPTRTSCPPEKPHIHLYKAAYGAVQILPGLVWGAV